MYSCVVLHYKGHEFVNAHVDIVCSTLHILHSCTLFPCFFSNHLPCLHFIDMHTAIELMTPHRANYFHFRPITSTFSKPKFCYDISCSQWMFSHLHGESSHYRMSCYVLCFDDAQGSVVKLPSRGPITLFGYMSIFQMVRNSVRSVLFFPKVRFSEGSWMFRRFVFLNESFGILWTYCQRGQWNNETSKLWTLGKERVLTPPPPFLCCRTNIKRLCFGLRVCQQGCQKSNQDSLFSMLWREFWHCPPLFHSFAHAQEHCKKSSWCYDRLNMYNLPWRLFFCFVLAQQY